MHLGSIRRTLIIVSLLGLILIVCTFQTTSDSLLSGAYPWVENGQYFVDCTVTGETVQFRYAMTYRNTSQYDVRISHIVCSFAPSELSNWYGSPSTALSENIQSGFVDTEDGEIIVPSGQERAIIFVFEGMYLGGELPNELSAPEDIIWGEQPYHANS